MPKHACFLENVLLCLLKSLCHFRQNLIHMFLIHFLKCISMFCRTHLKFTTFGVTPSYLSLKQEVTFPMRARTWPSEKRRCVPNPKVHVISKPGWCLLLHPSPGSLSPVTLSTVQNQTLFHLPFLPYSVQNVVQRFNLIFLSLNYF